MEKTVHIPLPFKQVSSPSHLPQPSEHRHTSNSPLVSDNSDNNLLASPLGRQIRHVFAACGEIISIKFRRRPGVVSVIVEYDTKAQAAEAVKYNGWTCSLLPGFLDEDAPASITVTYATGPRSPSPVGVRRSKRKTPEPDELPEYDEAAGNEVIADLKEARRGYHGALLALQAWNKKG